MMVLRVSALCEISNSHREFFENLVNGLGAERQEGLVCSAHILFCSSYSMPKTD